MSEYSPIATPESTSSEVDTADSKSKKKKKAIGAFLVEAEPQKTLSKLWGKDKKPEKLDKDSTNEPEASDVEKTSENNPEFKEELESEEKQQVVSQLAAARRQELSATEDLEIADPVETAAIEAYLVAAQADGDIEAAYNESISQLEADDQFEVASGEQFIDTDELGEGEIDLYAGDEQSPTVPPPDSPSGPPSMPFNTGGLNFNQPMPGATSEATVPLDVAANKINQAQSEGLVVGALVGYLVGRRRGRIKTEKRLMPVQKKLEKQVKSLQTELLTTESMVRQKVRERTQGKVVERATIPVAKPERQKISASIPPERIGHVVMAANANREVTPVKKPNRTETQTARNQAETMSRQQLLSVSEKVTVEGTTLRKIYETQLISEKGLRRLVAEHLRGGNVTRALQRELVEREIDFERDPILRDKDHGGGSDGAGKAALAAMLTTVGVSSDDESETIGTVSAKKQKQSSTDSRKQTKSINVADVSLLSLISVLTLIILALLFRG